MLYLYNIRAGRRDCGAPTTDKMSEMGRGEGSIYEGCSHNCSNGTSTAGGLATALLGGECGGLRLASHGRRHDRSDLNILLKLSASDTTIHTLVGIGPFAKPTLRFDPCGGFGVDCQLSITAI